MHDPMADPGRVDSQGILGTVLDLPDHLEAAGREENGIDLDLPETLRGVVVGGMGGSALAGEYAAVWAETEGDTPVTVLRGYDVPPWVDEDTLVLAVSYSGNTEETLAMFESARSRGARLAAVTSGGKLKDLAEDAGAAVVPVPSGFQPRAALGHLVVSAARVLEHAGLVDVDPALRESVKVLRDVRAGIEPEVSEENEAKRLAQALEGSHPVVYGSGILAPGARRFATQLNEMAKVLAFHGALPEMNHNEIVGWSGTEAARYFAGVLLRHDGEHPQESVRFEFTRRLLQAHEVPVVQVQARGDHPMARLLSTTFVGDAASVYLAVLREVDPTPVEVIEDLKGELAGTGFVDEL